VKFIRFLSKILIAILVVALLLAGLALLPDIQTWLVRREIAKHPTLHLTVGSVSAHFGKVEVTDLHWEHDGAVLTAPFIEARLPLLTALREQKLFFQSIVAKEWTFDPHPLPDEAEASAPSSPAAENTNESTAAVPPTAAPNPEPAPNRAYVFNGILNGWKFPRDVSANGIELEGDVMIPLAGGKARAPVHLVAKGGDLGAGQVGVLQIEASGTFVQPEIIELGAHGSLSLAMDTPRTLDRVELKTIVSAKSDSFPDGASLSVTLVAARGATEETYTVDLGREDRHLLTLFAHLAEGKNQLAGNWKIDLRDTDAGPLTARHPWPVAAISGEGELATDTTFAEVHALGRLSVVPRLPHAPDAIAGPLGSLILNTRFDAVQRGSSVRVDRLDLALGETATAEAAQPFTIELTTGKVAVAKPEDDWLTGTLHGVPLDSAPELMPGLRFSSGETSGDFAVRGSPSGYTFRSKQPFTATHVKVEHGGKVVAHDLDFSVSLLATQTEDGWELQCAPLTIDGAGHPVASVELKASQPKKTKAPVALVGKWNADFAALASQPGLRGLREMAVHSGAGNFSATIGDRTKIESDFILMQQDPAHSIAAKLSAEIGKDRVITFRAPLKITSGSDVLELSADGTWYTSRGTPQIGLQLSAKEADFDKLRLLAAPLAAIAGEPFAAAFSVSTSDLPSPVSPRDTTPFWEKVVGRIYVAFDKFKTGNAEFEEVRGTFKLAPDSITLETGQYQVADRHWLGAAEGSLSFDPAAEIPYRLKAKLDNGELDAATLFPAPPAGEDPVFHGRFSVACTLQGSGATLSDLLAHTQEEFRMKSTGGIVRLLKTHLTGLTQQKESTVGNVADTVGTMVGKLAGIQKNATGLGRIRLDKTTEAVLNFSYQSAEIGYNEITLTATRGFDGTIHVMDLVMVTPDEHVTGTGEIAYAKGRSPVASPLSIELKFGVRNETAELLAHTGLLSTEKDSLGYTLFKQPVHFGGTLQQLDLSQWHDLLFAAATRKPEPEAPKRP